MNLPAFSRPQLVAFAEIILSAAIDRIQGEETPLDIYGEGAAQCAGMALATLAAQVTGSGMGIGDALALAGFDRWQNWPGEDVPDAHVCALAFVNAAFPV